MQAVFKIEETQKMKVSRNKINKFITLYMAVVIILASVYLRITGSYKIFFPAGVSLIVVSLFGYALIKFKKKKGRK